MKTANDIFTWIFQSGAIVWLFYFGLVIAKPWVDGKIKHAKTAQQREAWTLLEQVAMTTVNSLVSSNKSGSQKFLEASDQVQSYLADHGVHIDMKTVQSAVQAAYEKSPLTPTTNSKVMPDKFGQNTAKFVPKEPDPVLEAIKTAPNRADKLLVADGSITQAKG